MFRARTTSAAGADETEGEGLSAIRANVRPQTAGYVHGARYGRWSSSFAFGSLMICSLSPSHSILRPARQETIPSSGSTDARWATSMRATAGRRFSIAPGSQPRGASDCGVDGLIASGLEAARLRRELGHAPLLITPGIRAEGKRGSDDQKRTMTVEQSSAPAPTTL
jgi:hypothetical protein